MKDRRRSNHHCGDAHAGYTCVSSSPSKIPYGGFSPVRLQTRNSPHDLHCPKGQLIRRASPGPGPLWPRRAWVQLGGGRSPGLSRPQALGSPAGSAVPPGLRLLWPDPSLSSPPTDLCIRRRAVALPSYPGGGREVPQFTLPVCFLRAAFPTPADWATALGHYFITHAGLPSLSRRSASALPRHPVPAWSALTRLQSSLPAAARKIASPAPVRTFTLELSPPKSPPRGVKYNYAGK